MDLLTRVLAADVGAKFVEIVRLGRAIAPLAVEARLEIDWNEVGSTTLGRCRWGSIVTLTFSRSTSTNVRIWGGGFRRDLDGESTRGTRGARDA